MSERCVSCGNETDGNTAVFTDDHEGNEVKWPLCHEGPSPTCYEKWTLSIPRTSPAERIREERCGGLDPAYPGQSCGFPKNHDGPCIDVNATEG